MNNITGIFTVVEVISGRPAITNFTSKEKAKEAFVQLINEQLADAPDNYKDEIDMAIKNEIYTSDDYSVELQETDLVG